MDILLMRYRMKKFQACIFVCVAVLSSGGTAMAGWLNDYRGTLGKQQIGMMIEVASADFGPQTKFDKVHYFYVRHLKNIPLKEIKRQGRNFILEEVDASGKPIARFRLEFPEYDRLNRFPRTGSGPLKLTVDEIVGTWDTLDGKQKLPVQLYLDHSVAGKDGGRCDLTAAQYRHVEDRAKSFRDAVLKNDVARLKRDFQYAMPSRDSFRKDIEDAVPHDLFCRNGIFILGNGPIGFDERGNISR